MVSERERQIAREIERHDSERERKKERNIYR